MTSNSHEAPRWSTAADGESAETKPMELDQLGDHLMLCRGAGGSLHGLRNAIEQIHSFAASRFITTLVVAAVAIGAVVLLF